jgi:hypothetical protein
MLLINKFHKQNFPEEKKFSAIVDSSIRTFDDEEDDEAVEIN